MRIRTTVSIALVALAAGAVGCGEELFQSLVDIRDATDDECEHGGQLVFTGVDSNGNGVLDDNEVEATRAICNGDPGIDGEQGIPGTNALLRTTEEAPGDNCADGGVKIEVGLDDNGNGTLDEDEISATSFVCNGAQGPAGFDTLVRTLPDAPSCGEFGGITVQSGVDDDRDGVLDDNEVDSTDVICNGTDGFNSLVEIVAEPAGANCTVGGQQITSGLDSDRNGVLEGTEIVDVVYVCDSIPNLVTVSPELEGESTDCPDGGSRIDAGLDTDASGTLEPGEIATTTFVCNGDDGLPSLVVVSAEPAGANCADGGNRIDSGLDTSEDGVLDAEEINSTQYVCNGADGLDGADGAADLVRVSSIPEGETCSEGGILVETGPDVDADDVLDPEEVTGSSAICDGVSGISGVTSLIDITTVAPGADCVDGGQRIDVGADLDRNDVLDPNEVTSTTFVCNGLAAVPFAILEDPSLPDALANSPYDIPLTARGGTGGDYAWTVTSGALPPGLSVDPTGTPGSRISGLPTLGGTYVFTIQVTDFFGQATSTEFTLFVQAPLLEIETFVVSRPVQGSPYSTTLTATGGTPPYTWSVAEGTLPTGLSLDAGTGVVSGTPTGGLPSTVLVRVEDAATETRDARITFHDTPRWAGFAGDFVTDGVYELGLNNIEGGVVTAATVLNPPPVSGGDLGQSTSPSVTDVKFSANGDRVSFTGDFDLDLSEEIWWVDLSGAAPGPAIKANAPFTTGDQDVSAGGHEWSSDGRFLAFVADDVVNSEINLFLVDTLAVTPTAVQVNPTLQADQDVFTGFAFSPDGTLLAYEADHGTTDVTDLWVVDLAAAVPTPVNVSNNTGASDTLTFQWSPDSSSLLYTNDLVDGVNELFLANVAGGIVGPSVRVHPTLPPTADVNTTEADYGFSPDGSRIFYLADANVDGLIELFVVDVASLGVARQVSATGITNTSQDVELAAWTPDSRSLVFAHDAATLDVMELWLGDATGTLSGGPVQLSGPMVSGGDIGQSTSPSNNDVIVDPAGRGVFYAADEVTASREDLFFAAFAAPGASNLLTTNFGSTSDVNSFLVAQDASVLVFNGDPTASSVDELYGIDLTGPTPGAPQLANKPLVASGDVDTSITSSDWFIVGDGEAVVYVADADTDAVDEAYYTALVNGAAGTSTTLNPPMVTSGDNTIVYREN